MKPFHIILPSWLYKLERHNWAQAGFTSLISTVIPDVRPTLWLILRDSWSLDVTGIDDKFLVKTIRDPQAFGTEQTLAYGTQLALNEGAEYIVWLGDDLLVHPDWLIQLDALIDRHPDALAWSVYRSTYEHYHRPTGVTTELDVETNCLCGHGLTFTAAEWQRWGIDWRVGHWPSPAGDTLDLHHSWLRQPEGRAGGRWCTRNSYLEHTGVRGQHCTDGQPEYAQNFMRNEAT